MSKIEFVMESAEDFEKDIDFDKFMDEIVITEEKKKNLKTNDDLIGEYGRQIIQKSTERPSNNIKFKKS